MVPIDKVTESRANPGHKSLRTCVARQVVHVEELLTDISRLLLERLRENLADLNKKHFYTSQKKYQDVTCTGLSERLWCKF